MPSCIDTHDNDLPKDTRFDEAEIVDQIANNNTGKTRRRIRGPSTGWQFSAQLCRHSR